MAEPQQQDLQRPEAATPSGEVQATAPNQPTTSSNRDGSTPHTEGASHAPNEDARNPTAESAKAERMDIEDADELAMQLGNADMTILGRKQRSSSVSLQPDNIEREPLKPLPNKEVVMGTTMTPNEIKEARKQWRAAGKPNCLDCGDNHPPPCDPEIAAEKQRLEDLKTSNPEEWAVVTDARKLKRQERIEAANQANAEKQQKQNEDAVADGKPIRTRLDFRQSLTNPAVKPPKDWCMMCLACHPRQNSNGSFHILTWQEAEAYHQEIQNGARERVNPLEQILAAAGHKIPSASKPVVAQPIGSAAAQPKEPPKPPPSVESTFSASEQLQNYIESVRKTRPPEQHMSLILEVINNQRRETASLYGQQPYAPQPPYGTQQPYGAQPPYAPQPPYGAQQPYAPQQPYGAQQPYGPPQQGPYANPAPAGSYYNPAYPPPGAPAPIPTAPLSKKRKAELEATAANKKTVFKGQKAKPVKAALGGKTPNPSTTNDDSTPAPGPNQPQTSNPLHTVNKTGQTKAMIITDVPNKSTSSKLPSKGDATAALQKANEAAKASAPSDNAAAKPAAGSKAAGKQPAPVGEPT